MKKQVLILVMLLMAATAFNQTSRRPANNNTATPKRVESRKDATSSSYQRTSTNANTNSKINNSKSTIETRRTVDRNTSNSGKSEVYASGRSEISKQKDNQPNSSNNRNAQYQRHPNNYHQKTAYYPSTRKYKDVREIKYHYTKEPYNIAYRAVYYPYRAPIQYNFYWNRSVRYDLCRIYPTITINRYPAGYRIRTISAYDAMYYTGEIMNVYGKVSEVFYSAQYDEYIMYIGPYYPYHDFTIVIPGWIARKYSSRPALYFQNQYIVTTGLITSFDGKPEVVIQETFQLKIY